jgi:hypothetical protein
MKCEFCNADFSFIDKTGEQVIIEKTTTKEYKHEQLIMNRCNECKKNKINISILGSKIHNDENQNLSYKSYVNSNISKV